MLHAVAQFQGPAVPWPTVFGPASPKVSTSLHILLPSTNTTQGVVQTDQKNNANTQWKRLGKGGTRQLESVRQNLSKELEDRTTRI